MSCEQYSDCGRLCLGRHLISNGTGVIQHVEIRSRAKSRACNACVTLTAMYAFIPIIVTVKYYTHKNTLLQKPRSIAHIPHNILYVRTYHVCTYIYTQISNIIRVIYLYVHNTFCSQQDLAATLLHHTKSYKYKRECLLVSSVGCYWILCELSETGPWSSPSGDSAV